MRSTDIDANPWTFTGSAWCHVSAYLCPVSDYRGFLGAAATSGFRVISG